MSLADKAAARRNRVRAAIARPERALKRDPALGFDNVPVLQIGRLRIKTTNRVEQDDRGKQTRTPPRR